MYSIHIVNRDRRARGVRVFKDCKSTILIINSTDLGNKTVENRMGSARYSKHVCIYELQYILAKSQRKQQPTFTPAALVRHCSP